MQFLDIILKKRNGENLSKEEIDFLVGEYVAGKIPDYQMSAFLMAVYFNSLNRKETAYLTESMANSGDKLDLTQINGFKVDKHSSGGVGDSVSLILVPLVRSVGLKIGKLSGRGLGHTGGTIDKLESIPGFNVDLTTDEFLDSIDRIGMAIMEHTSNLVPADQKLYELRDVTGTVKSLPLIISSIMSKKIACGPDGIVLDIKTGSGAIVDEFKEAEELAGGCVDIGREVGLKVSALITDMNQPLGRAVGNALEIKEAIKVLKGEKAGDLKEVTVALVAELLLQSRKAETLKGAREIVESKLTSGEALSKFEQLVENQGGNPEVANNTDILPGSDQKARIKTDQQGFVGELDALKIGRAANLLGAGRSEKGQKIDPGVGIQLERKVGEEVTEEDPLAVIHYNDEKHLNRVKQMVGEAYNMRETPPPEVQLIKERVR
ncbi:thymidine phosphorylase [Candidatus Bipolaricaulota bacterium]|nr:thymidine phosphorylase [Candidatus Bipolaricaulota bacterium]